MGDSGIFIGFINTTRYFTWGFRIGDLTATNSFVKMDSSGAHLALVAFSGSDINILAINKIDGSILTQFKELNAGLLLKYGIEIDSNGNLFLALKYGTQWRFSCYNGGVFYNIGVTGVTTNGAGLSLLLLSDNLYISGLIKSTTNSGTYSTITNVQASTGSIQWNVGYNNWGYPSTYYEIEKLAVINGNSMYAVMSDQKVGQREVTFVKLDLTQTGSSMITQTFRYAVYNEYTVLSLSYTISSIYMLSVYTVSKALELTQIKDFNTAQIQVNLQTIGKNLLSSTNFLISKALVLPSTNRYFVGKSDEFKPFSLKYTYPMGFIMSSQSNINCNDITDLQGGISQIFYAEIISLSFSSLPIDYFEQFAIVDQTEATAYSLVQIDLNSTDNSWCPIKRVSIDFSQSVSVQQNTYVTKNAQKIKILRNATVSRSCNDAKFVYYYNSGLGSFMDYFIGNNSIGVYTNDPSLYGVYGVNLTVKYEPTYLNHTVIVPITVKNCSSAQITSSSQYSFSYVVGNTAITMIMYNFTVDIECELGISFTYQDQLPFDTEIFSFNQTSLQFIVNTTNNAKKGVYNLMYKGYVKEDPSVAQTIQFTVNVIYNCYLAIFTINPQLSMLEYDVSVGNNVTVAEFQWTQDVPECQQITYTIYDSSFESPDPLIFDMNVNKFTMQSSNMSLTGKFYSLYVYATNQIKTQAYMFQVKLVNACQKAIITPKPIDNRVYLMSVNEMALVLNGWESSSDICYTFSYEISVTPDPGNAITYSSVTSTIRIQSDDVNLGGVTYTITVTGFIDFKFAKSTTQFDVLFTDYCMTAFIQPSFQMDIMYKIAQSTTRIQIPVFQSNASSADCGYFTYKISEKSGKDISFLSLNQFSNLLEIFTDDDSYSILSPFDLKVTGQQGKYEKFAKSTEFRLTVEPACGATEIIPPESSEITYKILESPIQVDLGLFQTLPYTCALTYYCQLKNGKSCDAKFIRNFDEQTGKFNISTSDFKKLGTYDIEIVGYVGLLSSAAELKVKVIIDCTLTTINPTAISDRTFSYKDPALEIEFSKFSDSLNCQPDILYTAVEEGQLFLPNDQIKITFDAQSRKLLVESINFIEEKNYAISLKGTYLGKEASIIFHILYRDCTIQYMKTSIPINKVFYLTEGAKTMELAPFTLVPACSIPITYTSSLANGSPLPSFISFSSANIQYRIETENDKNIGVYNLKLIGQTQSQGFTDSLEFSLTIAFAPPDFMNKGPPYFKTPLEVLEIVQGTTKIYTLPEIADDNNDKYKITLKQPPIFAKLSSQNIIFTPKKEDVGSKSFQIVLSDLNVQSMSQSYQMDVIVLDADEEQVQFVDEMDDYLKNPNKYLKAYIKKTYFNGNVLVVFSQDIIEPANITAIDNRTLQVSI
ncbi:ig family protein [Stylonychia lemnae]|uniref:Ig family protein n=1 Tax=Stylonychia lemnae TaxID=5949 RepID=A0A078AV27_STYLE|nr:ig family protein [Stylonychia lemnae]|eukprot:CDW86250.1 ig family protein [Stylonychia lemnae]